MKATKVVFTQAVLKDPNDLLEWFEWETGLNPKRMGWDVASHHMTIEIFKKGKARDLLPLQNLIGQDISLQIIGYAYDEKGMVVLVEPEGDFKTKKNPHITIATNGVGAKYSNELIEKSKIHYARGRLEATVGWKNSRGNRDEFELPWEFNVPMPSYDYEAGLPSRSPASWNSTPQRIRTYAKELIQLGFLDGNRAQGVWKNDSKLEELILSINARL